MVIFLIMRLMVDPVVILIVARMVVLMARMARIMARIMARMVEVPMGVIMGRLLRVICGLLGIGFAAMAWRRFLLRRMDGLVVILLLVMRGSGNFVRKGIMFIKTLAGGFGLRHLLMGRTAVLFIAPFLGMTIL